MYSFFYLFFGTGQPAEYVFIHKDNVKTVHVPSDINDVLENEVIIGAENGSEENGLENDQTADKAERNDEVIIGAENGSEENGLENDQTADEAEQNV